MKIEELHALGASGSGGALVLDGTLVGVAQLDGTVRLTMEGEELLATKAAAPAEVAEPTVRRGRPRKAEPVPADPALEEPPVEMPVVPVDSE